MLENNKITILTGTGIPLPGNDIDTDRIIPARFLKCVTFDKLGEQLFYDQRYDKNGNPKQHPLNDNKFRGGSILIVNRNFGCGSSREHAPQALLRYGIKALIGESFAGIFAGNCFTLGLPVVTGKKAVIDGLLDEITEHPERTVSLDIVNREAGLNGDNYPVNLPDAARASFINGTWDSVYNLIENKGDIISTVEKLPYMNWR
jgi:3-isopropylmalate/(R)-2-methylmalate dehydratase small subunit